MAYKTILTALILGASCALAQPDRTLVERAGSTAFIQLEAESFRELTPKQQALGYWLSQAAIAIDPIIYDQASRFGLRQKRILEAIAAHPEGIDPAAYAKVLEFTKLFWANRANHNDTTAQKFLPAFTFDELKAAGLAAIRRKVAGLGTESAFLKEIEALRPSLFDPDFEPLMTAKSPRGGLDILQASANNFYSGVSLADAKGFVERYPLNSRLFKRPDGRLEEQVYRAGTPDGKVAPGLYADYLRNAIRAFEQARAYADPPQAEVIASLIRFYQTGDPRDWIRFGAAWVQNNADVDFANGFIEVYRDARGSKGTSQAFVTVTDRKISDQARKVAASAQYFEDHAPWLDQYKKQAVQPPVAKVVEVLIETGDFHVNTIGDNLPNENEIHEKYGTKSFMFTASARALTRAAGTSAIDEFAWSKADADRAKKYGAEADELMTTMHEIIGHGSGKLSPKLTHEAAFYLKEYASALEEGRADLMALWNAFDPKLKELGVISSPEAAKAMYDSAARVALTQLRRIPKGDTIEEDHQRDRQLISNYIMDTTGAIVRAERDGKAYIYVRDYEKMRQGVGALLIELMRIKAEGDYDAIRALVDKYGVHFDPKLRDQVLARYNKLNLPTYWAGVYPELTAAFDPSGKVSKVTMTYPRDVLHQYLRYSQ